MNAQTERTTCASTKGQVGAPHHYQCLLYTNERAHAFIWSHTCSPHRSVFHPTKSNIQYMYLIIKTNMFSFHYWFSEVEFTPSGYRKDIWGHEHLSFCCNHRVWHKMFTFNGQSAWWVANCHLRLLHIARGCVCEGLPLDLSIRMIGSWPCMFWQHHDYITRPIYYKIYQIYLQTTIFCEWT